MENKYKHTKTTVSLINYHIVFCPRYRRKIFNIPGVEDRFKELTAMECENNNIDIIDIYNEKEDSLYKKKKYEDWELN